jgi:hypothetical protein
MKRIFWIVLLVLSVGATATWAGPLRARLSSRAQAPQAIPVQEHRTYCLGWAAASNQPDNRPLVWILDGAGDLKGCSTALAQANVLCGEPIVLAPFPWSHGYRKLLKDQIDTLHARQQGFRLAQAIQQRKALEPGRRVVVVGHSAGCAVALAAGDVLPPDTVDRFILLAPSVSTGYDLRRTIHSAKEGLDVYCSKKDWVALGFVIRVVGTTDNPTSRTAAGRHGFQPTGPTALNAWEAARFRQHFWSPEVAWTGHAGGHHGMFAPAFIQTYLMPLMTGS